MVCGTAARGTAGVVGHCGTRYSCTWHCGTGHTRWYGALWYGVQRAVWGTAVRYSGRYGALQNVHSGRYGALQYGYSGRYGALQYGYSGRYGALQYG